MSVLTRIRSKAGLLVTIVGIALVVFILQSALESSNFFWNNNDRMVGEIAGKGIDYVEFNSKVEEMVEMQKKNSNQSTLDENTMDMIVNQVWSEFVNQQVMNKEYENLGIKVSEDELYDMMMGSNPHPYLTRYFSNQQTGRIIDQFAKPDGSLNNAKVIEYTQQMNPEQETSWVMLEKAVQEVRVVEKYNNLIKKGLYVSSAEAKNEYTAQNKLYNIQFVAQRYISVADSTITVDEAELKDYYNKNQYRYKQNETVRKIDYVTFDVVASEQDKKDIQNEMNKLAEEFKAKEAKDDSSFVIAESDTRFFDNTYHKKGNLPAAIDSIAFTSAAGTIVGPYLENNSVKVAKILEVRMVPDSAKARHILIKPINGDLAKTKAKADSLKKLVNTKNFAELAQKNSEDGSAAKGGDLGWFQEGTMVKPFQDAVFFGKKGEVVTVESQFGIHIIEIQDKGKESERVKVAMIERIIKPSSKTINEYYLQASEFAGKNNTPELFEKAIADLKLTKKTADNIKENDKFIAGVDNPRELVRWAYNSERGAVSKEFELGSKFVVAHLVGVKDKGILPFEEVKEEVKLRVVQQKKAEKFVEQFNTAMNGNASIEAVAQNLKLSVDPMENLNFKTAFIPGAGKEDMLIGSVVTMNANTLSKPIVGENGVYIAFVKSVKEADELKDVKAQQTNSLLTYVNRAEYQVVEALKDNANILDHRGKFY